MAQLVGVPARRAGDPGSNPGPGENFSLKLLIDDNLCLPEVKYGTSQKSISSLDQTFGLGSFSALHAGNMTENLDSSRCLGKCFPSSNNNKISEINILKLTPI